MSRLYILLVPALLAVSGCSPSKKPDVSSGELSEAETQVQDMIASDNSAANSDKLQEADAVATNSTDKVTDRSNQSKSLPEPQTPDTPDSTAGQKPAGPAPTHKVAIACAEAVRLDFTFSGRTESLNFGKGPQADGQNTLKTVSCPKIMAALNGKSFPIATTKSTPQGGPKVQASCNAGIINILVMEGDPYGGGSFASVAKGADIESNDVCLQIRNVINGLSL